MILLQLASLQGYSQTDVWPGPDSSICMTKKKAAELANMMDSLSNLYTLNELLEETIRNSDIVIKSSEEALSNLFNQKYQSIAAASVLAKTHRDAHMLVLHEQFPVYQWDSNKGYPTQAHRQAIVDHGSTDYHRQTFQFKTNDLNLPKS